MRLSSVQEHSTGWSVVVRMTRKQSSMADRTCSAMIIELELEQPKNGDTWNDPKVRRPLRRLLLLLCNCRVVCMVWVVIVLVVLILFHTGGVFGGVCFEYIYIYIVSDTLYSKLTTRTMCIYTASWTTRGEGGFSGLGVGGGFLVWWWWCWWIVSTMAHRLSNL